MAETKDQTPSREPVTYNSYLKVDDLLSLQQYESVPPAHDELLFIVIHQAYELWFKQILFELDTVARCIVGDDVYEASRLLRRVLAIERLLVQQIHILDTMTPRDFLSFRKALNPASGFQSAQFREVEYVSGIRDKKVLGAVKLTEAEVGRLTRRRDEPSVRTLFFGFLKRHGFDVSIPRDGDGLEGAEREHTLAELGRLYEEPELHHHIYSLAEALVEHDQNLLLWRFHHVRVVERLIGTKMGTGGSSGVNYLNSTLSRRAFPLLWQARSSLSDDEFYGTSRGPTQNLDG